MIRTIITVKDQILRLVLPKDWIGKSIEVIAFSVNEPSLTPQLTLPGQKNITVIEVPQISYRFNRDELHER
jgi:hypothetical protein